MSRKKALLMGLALVLSLPSAGCATRSISDSGYPYGRNSYCGSDDSPYQGGLNELSVLGVGANDGLTEADIQAALSHPGTVSLNRGDTIVLIRSGAKTLIRSPFSRDKPTKNS